MNRNAIFTVAILFALVSLGAFAADGLTYGDSGETQEQRGWPSALDRSDLGVNRLGYEEPYDLTGDMLTGPVSGGSRDRCEEGLIPGELLRFMHFVRQPHIYLSGDYGFLDCEDRPGRDINGGSVEEGMASLP